MTKYLILLIFSFFIPKLYAQETYRLTNSLTNMEKKSTIDSICYLLKKSYVSEEKATKIATTLQNNLQNGNYDKFTNPYLFADNINETMLNISKDKHLSLTYVRSKSTGIIKPSQEISLKNYELEIQQKNYGFKELRILEGNIAYCRIDDFMSPQYSGETAIAALNFLSKSNAIIFDMRYNTGGDVGLIQLLITQLYKADTTIHLNDFYYRVTNSVTQMWTVPSIKGNKMPKMPVYVLTSNKTFSSAEAFAYDLQALKRGIIIGENTGGGANAGNIEFVNHLFTLFLPNEQTLNPITKTNWEAVGVIPDIAIAANKALDKAHCVALENLISTTTDKQTKAFHQWNYEVVQAKLNPISISTEKFKNYIGTYSVRSLSIENNKFYYQRAGKPKRELIALNNTDNTNNPIFTPLELSDLRIKIIIENNKTTAIMIIFQNGEQERHEKN